MKLPQLNYDSGVQLHNLNLALTLNPSRKQSKINMTITIKGRAS